MATYSSFSYHVATGKAVCDTIACDISLMPPPAVNGGYFAFARVKTDVCLVQVSSSTPTSSPLTTVDVKVFRHEFITIFRLSQTMTLHPSDLQILELIDDQLKCYEEDKETVFLAKSLTERLRTLTLPRRRNTPPHHRRVQALLPR
ncbi:hypothetical protein D9758_006906 [Tetrapyrgos nigripes]|uniref:Uncharacterized protein n=1 Tax=Tetrapyrgos nigripes TaxID=182062 RepID=A0A8H5GSH4_9AGAR|nr:hypothetical protein D9758_006906 [Tetrapyrgos nigripes]